MYRWQTLVKGFGALLATGYVLIYVPSYLSVSNNQVLPTIPPSESRSHLQLDVRRSRDILLKDALDKRSNRVLLDEQPVANSNIVVEYVSFTHCPKPNFAPGFKATCWYECLTTDGCNDGEWTDHVALKRAKRNCVPSQYMIGIRKCGTTDLAKWFQYQSPNHYVSVRDYAPSNKNCPVKMFGNLNQARTPEKKRWLNYGPGNIMLSSIKQRNETYMLVATNIQHIAFFNEPNSRYILTLRHPTDRLISYLFHAHRMKWIHAKVTPVEYTADFIHKMVVELVNELKECLSKYNHVYCVWLEHARDGNLKAAIRHGLYIVYVEHIYNLLPHNQIYINHLEEYSSNQVKYSENIMSFFGENIKWTDNALMTANKTRNCGDKKPVHNKTIELLDSLYEPFNNRLAKFLNNTKWTFDRTMFRRPGGTFCG